MIQQNVNGLLKKLKEKEKRPQKILCNRQHMTV